MVEGLAIRDPDGRPHLTRSRSHTTPSSRNVAQDLEETAGAKARLSPPRPSTRGRSHSYLSPTEPKPRNAQTLPTETTKHSHTLHLPGRSHREHKHHVLRHRHSKSEAQNSKRGSTDSLPHLVANLKREEITQKQRQNLTRQSTQTSTSTWQSHMNNLVRIASTDPYRNFGGAGDGYGPAFGAAYYRAYDGAVRQPTAKPQTWIELALDKIDAKKELERLNPKPADVERKQNELANAQDELRDRLADVGRQSSEIGRRLEYTYYALLEKVGSLVGTIHSFQSLSEQSRQLITNFESETSKLDEDIQRRIAKFRNTFEERDERVADMEARSTKAGWKAQELQTRLQNVRTIIENWEKREDAAAKKWFRVWGFMFWGSVFLLTLLMSVVAYKEWWFHNDPVFAGLGAEPISIDTRPGNHSLAVNVPAEVRVVLEGIEEKRSSKKGFSKLPEKVELVDDRLERMRDNQLRVLDEI